MKKLLLLPLFFFTLNCATTYKPISEKDTYAENFKENEDLKVSFGFQGLGENNRFRDNLEEENIALMRLSITNKTAEPITVDPADIKLILSGGELAVLPMQPEAVSKKISLASVPYWLWGLLWVGKTECAGGDCESTWFPVGLIVGAINFFMAGTTNSKMHDELVNHNFTGGAIRPGGTMSGYLFYDASTKHNYVLQIDYQGKDDQMKDISLRYSF